MRLAFFQVPAISLEAPTEVSLVDELPKEGGWRAHLGLLTLPPSPSFVFSFVTASLVIEQLSKTPTLLLIQLNLHRDRSPEEEEEEERTQLNKEGLPTAGRRGSVGGSMSRLLEPMYWGL